MNREESDLQIQVADLLAIYRKSRNFVFFAVSNEAMGAARTGGGLARMARFKRMGMLAGVSDLCITRLGKLYCLELKKPGGVMSKDQKEFRDNIIASGAEYSTAYTLDEAIDALKIWGIIP
jgi:hypothetical protein